MSEDTRASEASKDVAEAQHGKNVPDYELTDQNLMFLKHLQAGMKVIDAYHAAGYTGTGNQPYTFYNRLKKKLTVIVENNSLDELRLRLELEKIISLPITDHTKTVKDHLKAIEVTDKLLNKNGSVEKPSITAFIIGPKAELKPATVIDVAPEPNGPPAVEASE